jgi:glutaredoxin
MHCTLKTVSGSKCGKVFEGQVLFCETHSKQPKKKYICEGETCRMVDAEPHSATLFTTDIVNEDAIKYREYLIVQGFTVKMNELSKEEMTIQFGLDCNNVEIFIDDVYKAIDDIPKNVLEEKEEKQFTIYSPKWSCKYCEYSMELLQKHNYSVKQIKLSDEELMEKFGVNFSVPQIFINEKLIGGYADLKRYLN